MLTPRYFQKWSGWVKSNHRPPAPKAGALAWLSYTLIMKTFAQQTKKPPIPFPEPRAVWCKELPSIPSGSRPCTRIYYDRKGHNRFLRPWSITELEFMRHVLDCA